MSDQQRPETAGGQQPPPEVLDRVAAAAARDAGGIDAALLDDFLDAVWRAVAAGRRLPASRVRGYRRVGEDAAAGGVALRALLDLYLSAAWRLWRQLPVVQAAAEDPQAVVTAGEVLLRATDDAVASLTEGYQLARRQLVRREESDRREFVDDLLAGTADVTGLLRRAQRFALDLSGPHAVLVVRAAEPFAEGTPAVTTVERRLQGSAADADALVATKDGALVVVFAAPDRDAVAEVSSRVREALGRPDGGRWRAGVGRRGSGPGAVVSSYDEARRALDLGVRLRLEDPVADASDLLVFEVLLRDRAAARDLVESVLAPLRDVRGGAEPYLATIETYFDTGGNATETARRLHLSVRAVTYRLARVRRLTGVDATRAQDRFGLQAAVLAARALGWSTEPPG
ncbi:PucR family transcriptional regulator [Kineococcus rubinsiae]|uniref:PucR family transcriptional regulator n=1 Tax=Kineococcus rubinsiae TaxID=2609562 RepID=UPI00143128A5|nr:helix-turn-helix domain-containing protein [Kineococcus rubinsiae]NIZ90979.1 PucR family transcriptional regulator [Kineococcus rubinsiae]